MKNNNTLQYKSPALEKILADIRLAYKHNKTFPIGGRKDLRHSISKVAASAILLIVPIITPYSYAKLYFTGDGEIGTDPTGGTTKALYVKGKYTGNTITVTGGQITGNVFGGIITPGAGDAYNNKVNMLGGIISSQTTGSLTSLGTIYTAFVRNGNAYNNQLNISGGDIELSAIGGYVNVAGESFNNQVNVSGGKIVYRVMGGSSGKGNVFNNQVSVSGGSIGDIVHGGFAWNGDAFNNQVNISGGIIARSIIGGSVNANLSTTGNAFNNQVNISGGIIRGNVYGGYSGGVGNAINNHITISGNPHLIGGEIVGGVSRGSGDYFTGNTLNFSAKPINVKRVAALEFYNFTIDPNATSALISADNIELGDTTGGSSSIKVNGVHSGRAVQAGESFLLMEAGRSLSGQGSGATTSSVQQGMSTVYAVETRVNQTARQVTAHILSRSANPQLKALPKGNLAGAMLIGRGGDAVAYDLFQSINQRNAQCKPSPFLQLGGDRARYKTGSGSHFTSKDMLLTGGVSYQCDELTTAAFVEAGWGSYDTDHSFMNAENVKADGHDRYVGVGTLVRYDFKNGLYTDGSLRAGRNRNTFGTHDIKNQTTGERAKYTLSSNYVGAHLGGGYLLPLDQSNQLDLSVKYLWNRLESKNAIVASEKIHFNAIESHRVRAGADFNHQYNETLSFHTGLAYEHEFDGKARANALGDLKIDAPSVRGGTGLFSLGASVRPAAYQNLEMNFKLTGYAGKRDGVGGSARISYAF